MWKVKGNNVNIYIIAGYIFFSVFLAFRRPWTLKRKITLLHLIMIKSKEESAKVRLKPNLTNELVIKKI